MLVAFLALVVVLGGVGWLMFGGGETGEVVSPRSSMDSVEQRPRSESAAPVTSPASPARPTISVSDAAASPAPIGAPPPSAGNAPVDATPPLQPSAASGVDAIPGLIARWTFDERGSNRVADSANGFASGVFLGEPGWLAPGRVGAAAGRFDGESYVVFEDAMPRGAYTKAAWVHRYTGDHDQPIFAGATGHALMISFRHGFRAVAGHNGRWDAVASPDPIPALRWHHIAVTYDPKIDGGRLTLFVDGNEVGHAIDVAVPNPETEMFIGTLGRATRFRGLLDDVRLYDRALASDEIRRLAASL